MALSVKIPNATDIGTVAPASTAPIRGETASADDFGAQIGEAQANLGATINTIGVHYQQKIQEQNDAVGIATHNRDVQTAVQQVWQDAKQKYPNGGPEQTQFIQDGVNNASATAVQSLASKGISLSSDAINRIQVNNLDLQRHVLTEAATRNINDHVAGLQAGVTKNMTSVTSDVRSGLYDVDAGLKAVDAEVDAGKGLYEPAALEKLRDAGRREVVKAAIQAKKDSGDNAGALALSDKYFGSIPHADDITKAIYAQETSSGANIKTSVTGARGPMQVQPATFKQYALPGESIDNPEDNKRVAQRYIDDLSAKSGGDPARIAVGYFSGAGNIAPPGSPTPWKRDVADPTGKSVSSYVSDVVGKMSKPTGSALLPDPEQATYWNQQIASAKIKTAAARSETWERQIIDANAGKSALPDRASIETDPALDEPHRNTLLKQYDAAAVDGRNNAVALANFNNPAVTFNPYDKDDKDTADRVFKSMGGGATALQAVVSRTHIMPPSAAASLRGSLVSGDPQRVASALTLTSNALNANPNIFVGVDGKADFENSAVSFRHYVDDLGMTADDAAKLIIRDQSPEYQAQVKARLKTEDIDDKIKKELTIGDLAGQFDQVPWIPFTDPAVGFDPKTRQEMYAQYAEQVKDRYLETGDMTLAKKQAADQLKRTWGISKVTGSQTVMQYPPDRAPVYANIVDAPAAIAQQAVDAVKAETGTEVDRKGLRLIPLPGITAQAYKSGQPVPYMLSWTDKNGIVQMLNPGRAFVPDPAAMRNAQSEQRRAGLDRGAKASELQADQQAVTPPSLAQYGFQ